MNKIEILGTNFVIMKCDGMSDFNKEIVEFKKTGYVYSGIIQGSKNKFYAVKRDTHKFIGMPGILSEKVYLDVLTVIKSFCGKILGLSGSKKHTVYYEPLESLICFSGDRGLIESYYSSLHNLQSLYGSVLDKLKDYSLRKYGISVISSQKKNRYCILDLAKDLVSDGASLIMDDSLHKYKWQGRFSDGYGNIIPVADNSLYPMYKITGIQGNQTAANLSLKFDFKAEYNNGTTMVPLEINRNLMLLQNGLRFQNMIALHVSSKMKTKLIRKKLIFCNLPGSGDVVIDLKKLSGTNRDHQKNTSLLFLIKNACLYNIYSKELVAIESKIQWTSQEIQKATEKSKTSEYYWSLNKDTSLTSQYGKKIFSLKISDFGKVFILPQGISQDDLRNLRKRVLEQKFKVYKNLCNIIYDFKCSKKTKEEYFSVKNPKSTKKVDISETELGLIYNCEFKLL